MLSAFADYRAVWIEITKSAHGHGGPGWEFGSCLWSPSTNRDGRDYYRLMRDIKPKDLVLHFYRDKWPDGKSETRIAGMSIAAQRYKEIREQPPMPGDWADMSPYYRVQLRDYQPFPAPLPLRPFLQQYRDDLVRDLKENQPIHYPFYAYQDQLRTVQGGYLVRCTSALFVAIRQALNIEESHENEEPKARNDDSHAAYEEAKKRCQETHFFVRNPALIRAAKQKYGYICQVCQLDFEKQYGVIGKQYVECHHKNPLSELPDQEWERGVLTKVEDVTVLCSNCHRMIHRRRPALTIDELRPHVTKSYPWS
jgi:hypothetical protein